MRSRADSRPAVTTRLAQRRDRECATLWPESDEKRWCSFLRGIYCTFLTEKERAHNGRDVASGRTPPQFCAASLIFISRVVYCQHN